MKEKTVDLFGNEVSFISPAEGKANNKALFSDYDEFLDKFEIKKTTDDCYTPDDVYDCILDYVRSEFGLKDTLIVRPFYPGGDYENCEYPKDCVVLDNPPFSIIAKIARFYIENDIKFFLFAPHLTLFSPNIDCARIVCGVDIIYENRAKVKTSFLTNMLDDISVKSDTKLYNKLKDVQGINRVKKPKYEYPDNLITVSAVQQMLELGVDFDVKKSESAKVSYLDCQLEHGKTIFGCGFLISDTAKNRRLACEEVAFGNKDIFKWELSEREKELIKGLK